MKTTYYTNEDLRMKLLDLAGQAGNQKVLASRMKITTAHLSDLIHGKRGPGPKILGYLKWKRVVMYMDAESKESSE